MNGTTIRELLESATKELERGGICEAREASIYLLGLLLETRRGQLLVDPDRVVDARTAASYRVWVRRRAAREPAQRIAATQEFYGLEFALTRDVLIPRPESEMLVDLALECTPRGGSVVDLGTGSGSIVIAVAVERPDLTCRALDLSAAALAVAASNAERHGVAARIEFCCGSFSAPPERWNGAADTVLSNPPYVSESEWHDLEPEVREHEPRLALVPAAGDGLGAYRQLVGPASRLLKQAGQLAVEVGIGQSDAVVALLAAAGYGAIERRRDLNRIERVVSGRRN